MRGTELLDKMELVDPALVAAADEPAVQEICIQEKRGMEEVAIRTRAWIKWAAAAACLCLIAVGSMAAVRFGSPATGQEPGGNHGNAQGDSAIATNPPEGDEKAMASANGVTIPPMEVTLGKTEGVEMDMIAFFIYQGRCYVGYEWIEDNGQLVGEYLGTSTGMIDEWTPQDGYVDYAGSISGDFYSVRGYDPSFMLCMKNSDSEIALYICNNGITMKCGSELYEDRLHLAGNYCAVEYETRKSWYYGEEELRSLYYDNGEMDSPNENDAVIKDFVNAMNGAEVLLWESVAEREGHTANSIYDTEIYHVYFRMNDGTRVHLRLYENGYVRYQGILDVCVQVPQEIFERFVSVL